MAREELISSAVSFLQDPSVSSAPIEKKIAFLQSKNLTQEEIDTALARTGESPSSSGAVTPSSSQSGGYVPPQQSNYRPPSAQGYGYGPGGPWQAQPPPPELPKRDWRDWFIMATVMGGVGYGLYVITKRYVAPLIAPPTPPQLQQDKESIDEQFSRAFALLDQLSTDTATLKAAEESRTERLDAALREVEDLVSELKSSSRRRDDETRRISEEVRSLKEGIPKAIEGSREGNDKRLRELGSELKSLKVLLGNRLGSGSTGAASSPGPAVQRPASVSAQPAEQPAENRPNVNGTASGPQAASSSTPAPPTPAPQPVPTPAPREGNASPFSSLGKPASIPAWQMAAANKSKSASVSSEETEQQSTPPPS